MENQKKVGRPYGSTKENSRIVQKFCKFSLTEFEIVTKAAEYENIALSRFISDATIEKAKRIERTKNGRSKRV